MFRRSLDLGSRNSVSKSYAVRLRRLWTQILRRKSFPSFELLDTRAHLTVTVATSGEVVDDAGVTSLRDAIELAAGIPGEMVELPTGICARDVTTADNWLPCKFDDCAGFVFYSESPVINQYLGLGI